MAKFSYAVKQLLKWGEETGSSSQLFTARKGHIEISAYCNGDLDELSHLRVRRLNEADEPQSDYYAGCTFDNVKPAIEFAGRILEQDIEDVREFIEEGRSHIPHACMMRKAALLQAYGSYSA